MFVAVVAVASGSASDASDTSAVSHEEPANGPSSYPTVSADGHAVAFISRASNLVPLGDTGQDGVFVRDVVADTTQRVPAPALVDGQRPAISANGQFVAFVSLDGRIFIRDRTNDKTEEMSVDGAGRPAEGRSSNPSIDASGRFVAFDSSASNLVADDSNVCINGRYTYNCSDVFVRDRQRRTTERMSVAGDGSQANAGSGGSSISADGRFVVFTSAASNLVPSDTNSTSDVFVHDRQAGTTERVVSGDPEAGTLSALSISADGRFVAYSATGVVNDQANVFVRDRLTRATEKVSVDSRGVPGNRNSFGPFMSPDGRFVVFSSYASNLVEDDTNDTSDVFMRDRLLGTTERVSLNGDSGQIDGASYWGSISADGRAVAFLSTAANVVPGDRGDHGADIFLRDRLARSTTLVSVGARWHLQAGRLSLSPWPPRTHKTLFAAMPVTMGGEAIETASVRCSASLGRMALRLAGAHFRGGSARCAWKIPAGARGKKLSGSISAAFDSDTVKTRFAAVLR
jgi:Tol biopolymer transport system component